MAIRRCTGQSDIAFPRDMWQGRLDCLDRNCLMYRIMTKSPCRPWFSKHGVLYVSTLIALLCGPSSMAVEPSTTGRTNLWPQSYNKICGPYSVGVVTRVYGNRVPFDKLCELTGFDSDRGASAKGVMQAIEACGLNAVLVQSSAEACASYGVPMIVCLRNLEPEPGHPEWHFAAVVPNRNDREKKFIVMTTSGQPIDLIKLGEDETWTGHVILVSNRPFPRKWDAWPTLAYIGVGVGSGLLMVTLCTKVIETRRRKKCSA